jgi:hypothetical protein
MQTATAYTARQQGAVMPIQWAHESCDLMDDPDSGARIIQLTSAAAVSNNIYGEQPYCSADGKRIIIARCQDFCFDEEGSLLVHELDTLKITMAVRKSKGVRGVFNNAWSGLLYYWTPERKLMRLSLETLEQKEVYAEEDPNAPLAASSVTPDQRYVLGMTTRLTGPGSPVFQIFHLDLVKKTRTVILEHPEICNPHLQYNPIHGRQILVQNNRGWRLNPDGSIDRSQAHKGTTLFVIDSDGRNLKPIPVGQPVTATCTGHECFVADTGKVFFSVACDRPDPYHQKHDARFPMGNLFIAAPGDEKPQCIDAPDHFCNHVSVSRCGRYFIADSQIGPGLFVNGALQPVSLIVGSLRTGKIRILVRNTFALGGGNQCTHTHPYLTTDNRYAIYNATPGIAQVFAAKLPPGFLESLD